MRRLGAVGVCALALLLSAHATAQIDSSGRTPRRPREPVATAAPPVASAPSGTTQTEGGATPAAPIGTARSHVRTNITNDLNAVALTLDDGYAPDPRILDLIRSSGLHGTAFLVGAVADTNPQLLRDLVSLGWMVCSHTYDHTLLTTVSRETVRREMLRGIEAVERVVGYRCPYFRAPYGSVNQTVVDVANELGVQLIGWESSLSDTAPRGTNPDLQFDIATQTIRSGTILLGHFGGTNSYIVLERLLTWLQDGGYRVGSVADLIADDVPPLVAEPDGTSATVTVDDPSIPHVAAAPVKIVRARQLSPVETAATAGVVAFVIVFVQQWWVERRNGGKPGSPRAARMHARRILAELDALRELNGAAPDAGSNGSAPASEPAPAASEPATTEGRT